MSKTDTADQQTWLPSDLMDEISPPPRISPDHWITSLDDGAAALDSGEDGETESPALKDGQTVNFLSLTKYGEAILMFRSAADWSVDRPLPPEAQQVCVMQGWQTDSLQTRAKECVESLTRADAEAGEYELSYFTWSDDIPHRFDAKTRSFSPG